MSNQEQQTPAMPISTVQHATGARWGALRTVGPVTDSDLQGICNQNYDKILPILADKARREKEKQDQLNAVKARLVYGTEP